MNPDVFISRHRLTVILSAGEIRRDAETRVRRRKKASKEGTAPLFPQETSRGKDFREVYKTKKEPLKYTRDNLKERG